jgi:hypothetical protein
VGLFIKLRMVFTPPSYGPYTSSNSPFANMSAIIGLNVDYKIARYLLFRLNPFGEMGIFGYENINILAQVRKQRLYGFGCQAGFSFNFK